MIFVVVVKGKKEACCEKAERMCKDKLGKICFGHSWFEQVGRFSLWNGLSNCFVFFKFVNDV